VENNNGEIVEKSSKNLIFRPFFPLFHRKTLVKKNVENFHFSILRKKRKKDAFSCLFSKSFPYFSTGFKELFHLFYTFFHMQKNLAATGDFTLFHIFRSPYHSYY
jgi:hypothetical protein